ncbi:hypothetical protein ACOSQ2_008411 [Xanthoceras sorbifolium]
MAAAALITDSFVVVALLVLISLLITKGYCACTLNDIHVGGARTGNMVGGKPEWKVTVSNGCKCRQYNIELACKGFQTTEPVDISILNKQGDTCLFLSGNPLEGTNSITFYYSWDTPFTLIPVSSDIDPC